MWKELCRSCVGEEAEKENDGEGRREGQEAKENK
jgi:hypothetical protein